MILNQFNIYIKGFRLDNTKEFKSTKWTKFYKNNSIICDYTSLYTPTQNSISKRLNRYILERLISIYKEKNIPLFLWLYIVKAITHIKNQIYNSIVKKTPYKAIIDTIPNISYIKILGSLTYTLENNRDNKLSSKANNGILVGFESSNNYLVYIPSKNKVISSRNVVIKEDLIYKDDFIVIEDYSKLLDEESSDYDLLLPYSNKDTIVKEDDIYSSNNDNITI